MQVPVKLCGDLMGTADAEFNVRTLECIIVMVGLRNLSYSSFQAVVA